MPRKTRKDKAQKPNFPVVAVGASAGGLEAYQRFLGSLPVDTGMAFVFILHLAASHTSALPEILSRATRLPVSEIEEGTPLEPNHVYVMPPGVSVTLVDGHFRLTKRIDTREPQHPIDQFMRSLAETLKENGIGVVLSGTGNDGALGIAEIRAAGGITFAQDDSAQQRAMPLAAEAAGVDRVRSPEEIATEIGHIATHDFARGEPRPAPEGTEEDATKRVLEILRIETGLDFSRYRRNTVMRRIMRRMALHRIGKVRDYAQFVATQPAEAELLYQDLLINVTAFFRDPESFDALKRTIFPKLVANKARDEPVRIWVPGCSTGQEAYSLAIAFTEFAEEQKLRMPLQLFATDVNGLSVERARGGLYPKGIEQDVSAKRLKHFFTEVDGHYRISKAIRDACVFARHDALADPPFSRIDLVACRNLLIYLEPVLQQRLLPVLHYALRAGGYLWLGSSETAASFGDLFVAEDPKNRIYLRRPAGHGMRSVPAPEPAPRPAQRPLAVRQPPERDPQRDAERLLLARYSPAAVVVDEDLNVVQFRGDTSPYLVPQGRASLNLLKMLREGLLVAVRGAIHRARRELKPVREEGLRIRGDGIAGVVSVVAMPLITDGAVTGTLVVFEAPGEGAAAQARQKQDEGVAKSSARATASSTAADVRRLRQELAATREYLQAVIEQLEAANEELQTSNEEAQSSNEELQSINEELETSREEIQSTNEELMTVNEELSHRNAELGLSNNDLANLLAGVQMPIVMLDWDLRIRRFTPAAEKLFNLIASDVGRPITDIKLGIDLPDVDGLLARVLQQGGVFEHEVKDRAGRWHWLRIRPYRTPQNSVQGALIMAIDIDVMKRAGERVLESEGRFQALADTAPVLIWMHGLAGCEFVNRAFETFAGTPAKELRDSCWNGLLHPEDREAFEAAFRDAFDHRRPFDRVARFLRHDGAWRWMKSIGMPRHLEAGDFSGFVGSSVDISELKEAEEELRAADKAKDHFLGTLGHELRNPLAAISNAAYLLATATADTGRASALAIIERQTRNMVRIVDDLLDVSRITHGKISLRPETVDAESVARGAIAATEHERAAAGQKLHTKFSTPAVSLRADPARLEQVLVNVLGNASKFAPPGGNIWIEIAAESKGSGFATLKVRDDGPGIDPKILPRVFELFVQGERVDDRARMGVGIGLALARHLVEMHGGGIEARNLDGKGSEIAIRLPMAQRANAPKASAARSRKASATRKVLVVDDNEDAATAIVGVIKSGGHEVRRAATATSAMQAVSEMGPDVVLLDIGLPDIDGYSLAKRLRSDPAMGAVRLIALTGYARPEDEERARDAGFDGHLAKPADPATLLEMIVAGD